MLSEGDGLDPVQVRNPNAGNLRPGLPAVPDQFVHYRRSASEAADGMDAAAQLAKSLGAAEGISHQSRVSQAMEEAAAKRAQHAKL